MRYAWQIRDIPAGNLVPGITVRVRRKSNGTTITTLTTDSDGRAEWQQDGHEQPFYLETTGTPGGPKYWASDDHMPAGAVSLAEIPLALRPLGDGVVRDYLNSLEPSLSGTTVTLETGAALVAGYPVLNYEADAFALSRPSSGTRVDRVIARVYPEGSSTTPGKAEFAILAGTVDAGAPALTQSADTYEISLAQISVPSAGSLTLTDERVSCLQSYVSRPEPVTGAVRSSSVSTSSSGGAALTGLTANLVLPDSVTYDCEAEFSAVQVVSDPTDGISAIEYVSSFGGFGSSNGLFKFPQQIALSADGTALYIADASNNRIQKFTSAGVYSATPVGGIGGGSGVTVDASGNLYVTGKVTSTLYGVAKYTSGGTLLWVLSSAGGSATPYQHVTTDGTTAFATLADTNLVTRMRASDGVFLSTFGGGGSGNGKFTRAWGIVTDGTDVWVTDQGNARVQRFNTSGTFETKWGSSGSGNGQFTVTGADGVRGIAHDATNSRIYVADTWGHRVQVFDEDGTFLDSFGTFGSGDGQLNNPTGIAVSSDGATIWVTDTSNHRVTKWAYVSDPGDPPGGYGTVAVEIDGNLSSYTGIGQRSGSVGNAHTRAVTGPKTCVVKAYGKATSDVMSLTSAVLSARCVARA